VLKVIDDYPPSLNKLQKMVGSDIQVITLKNGDFLVFNKAGRMKNLKKNFEATKIYHKNGGIKGMNIVGMAVVVKKGLLLKFDITTP
tara:strand:+ start:286 stop:546 length:261 start_codon:yes stop_codon:yes gene_type:complete